MINESDKEVGKSVNTAIALTVLLQSSWDEMLGMGGIPPNLVLLANSNSLWSLSVTDSGVCRTEGCFCKSLSSLNC